MKKILVTIAIPALNEEANIENLISQLLNQRNDYYKLVDLVIVSDGSLDNTVNIVEGIRSHKVRVVNFKERRGKSARLNDVFHNIVDWNKSEVVVLFDADTLPVSNDVIDNLVLSFIKDKDLKLVSGRPIPLKAKTFFEKVLKVSAFLQDRIKDALPISVFTCHGRSIVVHKDLACKIAVPEYMVGNDAFIYLTNRENNFGYKYITNANVYYRMPASFSDFKKQFTRFRNSQEMLQGYFGDWIKQEYIVSKKVKLKAIFWSLIYYPFLAPIYYLSYILAGGDNKKDISVQNGKWDISDSTKKL